MNENRLSARAAILRRAIAHHGPTFRGRALLELGIAQAFDRFRRLAADLRRETIPLAEPPVVIVGLQRSGTTWLHQLLAGDPRFWAPRFWELASPSRVEARWKRRARGHATAFVQGLLHPAGRDIHPIGAEDPEECWILFGHALGARAYDLHLDLPELRAHLDTPEVRKELYDFYHAQVELLVESARVGAQRRVVLKCPDHLYGLDDLARVFPGVDIVYCRRDARASVASFCSMTAMHRRTFFGRVDPRAVGRHVLEMFEIGVRNMVAWRDGQPHARVHEVDYDELTHAPETTISRLLAALGAPLDVPRGSALAKTLAATRHRAGAHAYRLVDWGLGPDEVLSRLSRG